MEKFIKDINTAINESKNIVITTHINPDGDAIGSELALARYLNSLDKNVMIINHSPTPDYLKFMLNSDAEIKQFNADKHSEVINNADIIFTVDLNNLSRTKSLENCIRNSNAKNICIDHHEFPEDFTDFSLIETTSSSTGELIYHFLKANSFRISYEIALPLYVAIMTDTGSFKYERTTADLHRIIAELLEAGVVPIKVHQAVYEQGSANRIKLLGRAFNSLSLDANGKIAFMKVSQNDLEETNSSEEDVEGFVNHTLSIKGVEIGIFFFELSDGFKISFRSGSVVPVNKLANEFNGGGHFFAAGARIENQNMEATIPKVIESAIRYINIYTHKGA
jgi:phosphoesterase RecJ-like protein